MQFNKESLWKCEDCGFVQTLAEMQSGEHPFNPGEYVNGCARKVCGSIDHFNRICDVTDCGDEATCGTPSAGKDSRYVTVCGRHFHEINQ